MFKQALPLFLLLAAALPVCAQLNLSAAPREYVSQGIIYQELSFRDGDRSVIMELPSRWTFRSSPARLQLIPAEGQYAQGSIEALPPPENAIMDEAAMNALQQQVLSNLPAGAQDVKVLQVTSNGGGPGGGESFEMMISFQAMGRTLWSSITFVNMPENRLVLRFTALEEDFQALHLGFRRAISSWIWK